MASDAEIVRIDRPQPAVKAVCAESGDESIVVNGTTYRSVRRALADLSEHCSCGQSYHRASDGEDQEEDDED
jgi:hypothetical protein